MNKKEIIAQRAAIELHNGDYVNLGIGIPSLVLNYIPSNIIVTAQSENGLLGITNVQNILAPNKDFVNASGLPTAIQKGGSSFDSSISFAMIRGKHIDCTILGAFEVDQYGNLANWIIPRKKVAGMGGTMDLAYGAKKVIVTMEHTAQNKSKILAKCTLPLTGAGVVDMIITEMGVFTIHKDHLILEEIHPDYSIEDIKKNTEAYFTVSQNLKTMLN